MKKKYGKKEYEIISYDYYYQVYSSALEEQNMKIDKRNIKRAYKYQCKPQTIFKEHQRIDRLIDEVFISFLDRLNDFKN